jgi:hypothetical protein
MSTLVTQELSKMSRIRRWSRSGWLPVVLGLAFMGATPSSSQATLIIGAGTPSPTPPGVEVVNLVNGSTGNSVTGTTAVSNTPVGFSSTQNLLVTGGNLGIVGGGAVRNLTVTNATPGNPYFTSLLFSATVGGSPSSSSRLTVTVTGRDEFDNPEVFSKTFTLVAGENSFYIQGIDGDKITSIALTTTPNAGITDIHNVQIGGVVVPEPSTLASAAGAILLSLGGCVYRRRSARV